MIKIFFVFFTKKGEKMRNFIFFVFMAIFLSFNSYANTAIKATEPQKIYIASDQLLFENESMFVLLNNNWEQINCLQSDANGIYITSSGLDLSFSWTCKRCGYKNSWWVDICKGCNKHYRKD